MKLKKCTIENCQRHFMTLLEVVIALGLVSLLLTAILGIYSYLNTAHKQMDKTRKEIFQQRYVQSRLSAILVRSVAHNTLEKDFLFFTERDHPGTIGESLVFSYDNGVDINPLFSNHVIGRLYRDTEQNLCITSWPSPKRWKDSNPPMKKEILLANITDLHFSLFAPPIMDGKVIPDTFITSEKEKKDPDSGIWHEQWLHSYQQLPAMIKVEMTRKNNSGITEKITFAYPFANTHKTILYKR